MPEPSSKPISGGELLTKESRFLPVLLLLFSFILGIFAAHFAIGRNFGYAISYVALILVSLGSGSYLLIGGVDIAIALLWVVLRYDKYWQKRWYRWLVAANRAFGHLELWFVWSILAAVWKPYLYVQLPLLTFLFWYGRKVIDQLAGWFYRREGATAPLSNTDLLWLRRPLFYFITSLGILLIILLAPEQMPVLFPLVVMVLVAIVLRIYRIRQRGKERKDLGDAELRNRLDFREEQAKMPRDRVIHGAVFLIVAVAAVIAWIPFGEEKELQPSPPVADKKGDLELFIVSDTQLHELRGPRFAGQLDLMEALVPVARRPIELDLLSGVTLLEFGRRYELLRGRTSMPWIHMGDFADLACVGELRRFESIFDRFPKKNLAGVTMGNHDNTFTGNFAWHPDHSLACPSGRADKSRSDLEIARIIQPHLRETSTFVHLPEQDDKKSRRRESSAYFGISKLGVHRGRALVGIFLDTSDRTDSQVGIAGIQGMLSGDALEKVGDQLGALREVDAAYADPLYVVFMHHMFERLTVRSKSRFRGFIQRLEERGPRVLAVIASHEHQTFGRCIEAGRSLTEIVVGSTIDPPQQAAMLSIDFGGKPDDVQLRLRSLPAVSSSGEDFSITSTTCAEAFSRLRNTGVPACRRLIGGNPDNPRCEKKLREKADFLDRIDHIGEGPETPEAIRDAQWDRADTLLACVCRGSACQPDPQDPLDERRAAYTLEDQMTRSLNRERREELVCLSWAASIVQERKFRGMRISDVPECLKDEAEFSDVKRFTARLGVPCGP